jgi:hypothetical protein
MKHPYRLVGENVVTFKETGYTAVYVVDRDQVEVQKGDLIGICVHVYMCLYVCVCVYVLMLTY